MANTYTQIYIQVLLSVQGRQSLIQKEHKEELYKYITGIARDETGHCPLRSGLRYQKQFLEMLKKFNVEFDERYVFQ